MYSCNVIIFGLIFVKTIHTGNMIDDAMVEMLYITAVIIGSNKTKKERS